MSDTPSSSSSSSSSSKSDVPSLRVARAQSALLSPTEIRAGFQVSVHECPKLLLRELKHVFPAQFEGKAATVGGQHPTLAVLTCQKSLMDLSQFGVDADKEKDRLLETFVEFAQHVSAKLIEKDFWVDFIDPCSGLPMLTLQSNKVYSEVDGVEVLLRYRCLSAGMCKILVHPSWGAAVYPASLFTNAPYEVVQGVIMSSPFNEDLKAAAAASGEPQPETDADTITSASSSSSSSAAE